jgi:predicted nucleic acid-binding Zn ribbon protein
MIWLQPAQSVPPARSWRTTVPTYEYRCDANGRLVEVRHNMAERLATWGEQRARAAGVTEVCC